jgi:hypothetical protein
MADRSSHWQRWLQRQLTQRVITREYVQDVQACLAAVPCPNRTCGAQVNKPCRGQRFPHPARMKVWRRAKRLGLPTPDSHGETMTPHQRMREQVIRDINRRLESLGAELKLWNLTDEERAAVIANIDAAIVSGKTRRDHV